MDLKKMNSTTYVGAVLGVIIVALIAFLAYLKKQDNGHNGDGGLIIGFLFILGLGISAIIFVIAMLYRFAGKAWAIGFLVLSVAVIGGWWAIKVSPQKENPQKK